MSFLNPLIEAELKSLLEKFQCQAGTVHVLSGSQLFLAAAVGIPAPVVQMVSVVPVGKGMAGLAAEREEAVQICNLQTDDSGTARPGAKATGMEGSIAVPIWAEEEGKRVLKGVLSVGKTTAHQYSEEEIQGLLSAGTEISGKMLKH